MTRIAFSVPYLFEILFDRSECGALKMEGAIWDRHIILATWTTLAQVSVYPAAVGT